MTRPQVERLVHAYDCPGARVNRRDGIEHALLSCSGCGEAARVPLRRDWTDDNVAGGIGLFVVIDPEEDR